MELVIIVAAGSGSRFGSDIPKQFLPLNGTPVLMRTIEAFMCALKMPRILLVLSKDMVEFWQNLCAEMGFHSPEVVVGGASRWESVKNAIDYASRPEDCVPDHTTVLIHDGGRPLVPEKVIRNAAKYAVNTDGAIPAVPVTDSLRKLDENEVSSQPVDRSLFRAIQTPQAFALWRLRQAYALPYQSDFTDDASVMAAAGFENIILFPGSHRNIKITSPVDMLFAETLLNHPNS